MPIFCILVLHYIYTNNYFWLDHLWWVCQCSLQSVIKNKNFKLNIIFLFDNDSFSGIWGYITCYKCSIFGPVHFCSWNPPFCWDQNNPVFLDQNYPSLTITFWTTQTEDLIQIKTKIGFCDLIWIQNSFSRFEPIWWPKSDQINFEQLAPVFLLAWSFGLHVIML